MKKRCLSLCLCMFLALTLLPDASAVGTAGLAENQFPSFGTAMGYYLDESPNRTYANYSDKSKNPLSYEELLQCAQEYVDLLVDVCPFKVISSFDKNSYGGTKTCYLRYTGTASMKGSLEAGDYIAWLHNKPYHLKVAVTQYNGSCWITVAWDEGLEAAETELRTPTGERLGKDRPSLTAVLALGYPKMAVGDEVVPVDTESEEVYPINEGGRTLVPVSLIVNAFGGKSDWNGTSRTATFTLGDNKVEVPIGSKTITVNGRRQTIDVAAKISHGRTYVPLRAVLESLGIWVGYEPTYRLVVVSTDDLSGENLVKLEESQRLFASEEVPQYPTRTEERYVIDGLTYSIEVGEALTLYNPNKPISTYYGYSWEVIDGGELVQLRRNGPTCRFYAKRPGTVTVKAYLDETILNYGAPSTDNHYEQTVTIQISPSSGTQSSSSLMKWQTCPTCNGAGTIRSGTRQVQCPTCLGQKQVLLP